ncbi:MAG: CHAT domain-containing protein [Planctomycetes bacterium]|nr:CHAT domain-containing protein [Planctomycetota bacterium]
MARSPLLAGLVLAAVATVGAAAPQDPPSPTGVEAVAAYLDALAVPSVQEVVAELGEVPTVAELVRAEPAPAERPALPPELRALGGELVRARLGGEHARGQEVGERMHALLAETYGADDFQTREAHHYAALLGALSELDEAAQARVASSFAATLEVPQLAAAGRVDEALTRALAYQRAVDGALGPDHAEAAANRYSMAALLYAQGEFDLARRSCCAAWRGLARGDGDLVRLRSMALNVLATLATSEGRLDDAERLARASLALRRATTGELDAGYAVSLVNLANVLVLAGELPLARDLHAHALDLRRAVAPDDVAALVNSLTNLGQIESELGRDAAARAALEEALQRAAELPQGASRDSAYAASLLAGLETGAGDLARAERLAREGLRQLRELFPDGHPDLANHRMVLARVLLTRGDFGAARAELEAARAVAEAHPGHPRTDLPGVLDLLASLEGLEGDAPAALDAARRALALRIELAPRGLLEIADTRRRLPRYLAAAGHLDEARAAARESRRELGALYGEHGAHVRGAAWRQEADLALTGGDLDAARAGYATALELLDDSAPLERAACELGLARLALRAGRLDEAAALLSAALERQLDLRGRVLGEERERALWAGRLELEDLSRTLARVHLAREQEERALLALERGRALPLLDLLHGARAQAATRDAEDHDEAARSALRAAEHRAAALRTRGDLGDRRAALVEAADRQVEQARAALAERLVDAPDARADADDAVASDAAASAGAHGAWLRDDERLLEFLWCDALVARFEVDAEGALSVHAIASGADEVERLHDDVLALLRGLEDDATPLAPASDLARRLLPADRPARERWIVVPDGPLTRLPLELLAPARPYSTAVSAASLAALRSLADEERTEAPRAVVVGDPRFDGASSPRGALTPLPGTRVEAGAVDGLLRAAGLDTRVLVQADANLAELERAVSGARYVHLATHGWPGTSDHPLTSGLGLALDGPDAEPLTLARLLAAWRGRLVGCRLVTLSACDSGAGSRVGDSYLGLSWGFWSAGAECTLVSRWRVDDRATVLFMRRFYEGLLGEHAEPREAGGERYAPGAPLPATAALTEARAWLAGRAAAENRRDLEALGLEGVARARDGFPRPGAAPTSRPSEASYDFSHPRYWAAFVLVGAPR